MISAYFLLLFFFFFFSGQSKELLYQLYGGNNSLFYQTVESTRIWPQTDWINYAYGVPAENSVILNMVFWLLTFAAFYFTSLLKKQRSRVLRRTNISFLLLAFVVGILTLRPSSKLLTGSASPHLGGAHDQYYYFLEQDQIKENPSNLIVTDMKLDLNIQRQLEAKVILDYHTDDGLEAQPTFTLYHGYKVERIRNSQQTQIDFTQENDYITLHEPLPPEGQLEFQYAGHGNRYYSNDQGMYLPANLIFYPVPGHVQVWDEETGGFLPFTPSQAIEYTVSIHHGRPVYSNLEQIEDNIWEGSARSLTLLSGLFREEFYNGVQYISPFGLSTIDSEWSSFQTVIMTGDEAWRTDSQQAAFVAQTPSVNQGGAYEAVFLSEDQVLFQSPVHLETYGDAYDVDPKKYKLQTILTHLSSEDPYMYESHLAIETQTAGYTEEERANIESSYDHRHFYARTEQLRKVWSDEEIIERFECFIQDLSDRRLIEDFFDDLEAEVKDISDD